MLIHVHRHELLMHQRPLTTPSYWQLLQMIRLKAQDLTPFFLWTEKWACMHMYFQKRQNLPHFFLLHQKIVFFDSHPLSSLIIGQFWALKSYKVFELVCWVCILVRFGSLQCLLESSHKLAHHVRSSACTFFWWLCTHRMRGRACHQPLFQSFFF